MLLISATFAFGCGEHKHNISITGEFTEFAELKSCNYKFIGSITNHEPFPILLEAAMLNTEHVKFLLHEDATGMYQQQLYNISESKSNQLRSEKARFNTIDALVIQTGKTMTLGTSIMLCAHDKHKLDQIKWLTTDNNLKTK